MNPRTCRHCALSVIIAGAMGTTGSAVGANIWFTSESQYLSSLAQLEVDTFFEGFEGADWEPTRQTDVPTPLTTQGLRWTAGENLKTNHAWGRTNWGLYDNIGGPDVITVEIVSGQKMIGFGGWFRSNTLADVEFRVDGVHVNTVDPLPLEHQFYGVINEDGFSTISFAGINGDRHWAMDDNTIAVPEPAALWMTALVVAVVRRRA